MIRSLLLTVFSTAMMATSAFADSSERQSPLNILDQKVAGTFTGKPSGLQLNKEVKTCSVSFTYDHEKDLGGTVLLYYKVKVDFPNFNYSYHFLTPEDFEFMVSRDYLLNFYPKNFVLQSYSDHRGDYKAIRLKFGAEKLSAVQTTYGLSGDTTNSPSFGWLDGYTCNL